VAVLIATVFAGLSRRLIGSDAGAAAEAANHRGLSLTRMFLCVTRVTCNPLSLKIPTKCQSLPKNGLVAIAIADLRKSSRR